MIQSPFLRRLILNQIEASGSRLGAPTVNFTDKILSVQGEDIRVAVGGSERAKEFLFDVSGFYLALPANVFGIVTFPDGTTHNMEGGVHEAPPGVYKVHYVDGHDRSVTLSPIAEMTSDGENVRLQVVLRYRVLDPIAALRTTNPVETLIEHVETDVAQYIRAHIHTEIADRAEHNQDHRMLTYFLQRHNRRLPFSRAFSITGIEIKEFTRDDEYLEMRRRAGTEALRNQLERQQVEYQQELTLIKAQFKAESERAMADHTAALVRRAAEHKAEIEKLEAQHEKEKQAILDDVHLREIELDNKRRQLQVKREDFSQLIDALGQHFASGNPTNPAVINTLSELLFAYKEELETEAPPVVPNSSAGRDGQRSSPGSERRTSSDKVEGLKNTLLNLLNPKK